MGLQVSASTCLQQQEVVEVEEQLCTGLVDGAHNGSAEGSHLAQTLHHLARALKW
jgi:hypothetical protein